MFSSDTAKHSTFLVLIVICAVSSVLMLRAEPRPESPREALQELALDKAEKSGEQVTFFGVRIDVQPDGALLVSMKVNFTVADDLLSWGIPISIPTGHAVQMEMLQAFSSGGGEVHLAALSSQPRQPVSEFRSRKLSIISIRLSGSPWPYELIKASDAVTRILPKSKEALSSGEHVIEVVYKLQGAIEVIDRQAVLDFPVVSSHLPIPVKQVLATFSLPRTTPASRATVSGFLGSRKNHVGALSSRVDPVENAVVVSPPRPLSPLEGMFASLRWQM